MKQIKRMNEIVYTLTDAANEDATLNEDDPLQTEVVAALTCYTFSNIGVPEVYHINARAQSCVLEGEGNDADQDEDEGREEEEDSDNPSEEEDDEVPEAEAEAEGVSQPFGACVVDCSNLLTLRHVREKQLRRIVVKKKAGGRRRGRVRELDARRAWSPNR